MKKIKFIFSSLAILSLLAVASPAHAAGAGEFCGGFAGITCDAGLHCDLDGNYPDAGGTCIPDYCGGFGSISCPEGYECIVTDPYPDATGDCEREGSAVGEFCGGIANVECQAGLVCELDGPYPDAGGICYRPGSCEERCDQDKSVDDSCWCLADCVFYDNCCPDRALYCE